MASTMIFTTTPSPFPEPLRASSILFSSPSRASQSLMPLFNLVDLTFAEATRDPQTNHSAPTFAIRGPDSRQNQTITITMNNPPTSILTRDGFSISPTIEWVFAFNIVFSGLLATTEWRKGRGTSWIITVNAPRLKLNHFKTGKEGVVSVKVYASKRDKMLEKWDVGTYKQIGMDNCGIVA